MLNYINQNQIDEIFNLSIQAGELAKKAFLGGDFQVFVKKDKSKVSSIDIEVSDLIHNKLSQIFPQIPIICEEGKLRDFVGETFFLIDPIDGTSSFVNNNVEFCINIALINNRQPIFGMIYAPLFEGGKMMLTDLQQQIILYNHANNSQFETLDLKVDSKSNNYEILAKIINKPEDLRIVTSCRTKDEDINNYVLQFYPQYLHNFRVEKLSSAIKFFRIIEGKSNLYLHFRPSMEWDTASGHALLNILGQKLETIEIAGSKFFVGDELQYKKNNFINGAFVVITQ